MMKATLLFALTAAIASAAGLAHAEVDHTATQTEQAISVAVYARDFNGSTSLIGQQVTHGEPVKFSRVFSYPVAVSNAASDAYDGHWSLTISNVRKAPADSTDFDVHIEGKVPGVWEGQVLVHAATGTGSHTTAVHWLDGKDYVITLHPVAG